MFRHFFIASLMICLSACGSSPKTHFYMLSTNHQPDMHSGHNAESVRIGLWKVKLPELLDKSEIVTRGGQYNIELADFHKWAGRLDNNISRLIANELSTPFQSGRIIVSPWHPYAKNDYQIKIHIDRFNGELGGEIVLIGTWILLNSEGNKELIREAFTFKTQTRWCNLWQQGCRTQQVNGATCGENRKYHCRSMRTTLLRTLSYRSFPLTQSDKV